MPTTTARKPRQRQAIAPVRIVWLRSHPRSSLEAIQINSIGQVIDCPGWPELIGAILTNHARLKPGVLPVILTCHGRIDLHRPIREIQSFT
jgi:hypothetical protein